MPKTLTTKELKTIQLMELLNEIKSPYDQIEIITNLFKEIWNKRSKDLFLIASMISLKDEARRNYRESRRRYYLF